VDTELTKGTLSLLILSVLKREPMYGYRIASTMRADTDGAFAWTEGSLYPCLHKLESGGLVKSEWDGEPGSRRRKYYSITRAGERLLAEKTASWLLLSKAVNQVLEKSNE
jgi:PadR family transcriptional regulator, regulatory protein PadR